jgi:hypothetical protein
VSAADGNDFDWTGVFLNRVLASLTLFFGLVALMVGVYAEQWTVIEAAVRTFLPFFG